MGIVEEMDRKREYLRQMRKDQGGINPKLSIWNELETKCRKVEEELATLGALRAERSKV